MHGIVGVVDVEHDLPGWCLEAPAIQINLAEPMRASARQSARISSRDKVGWLMRSPPLSGARPTAIFNAGSVRKASTSSQSS